MAREKGKELEEALSFLLSMDMDKAEKIFGKGGSESAVKYLEALGYTVVPPLMVKTLNVLISVSETAQYRSMLKEEKEKILRSRLVGHITGMLELEYFFKHPFPPMGSIDAEKTHYQLKIILPGEGFEPDA